MTKLDASKEIEKRSRARSVGIGRLLGAAYFVYCIVSPDAWDQFPLPFFEIQFLAGLIVTALILSPMQEIYFRMWLQPRLEELIGASRGLFLTSLLFMFWHLMLPFQEGPITQTTIEVVSIMGCVATFLLGLVCGTAYVKSRRLLAPWLAHTIAGLMLVFLGKVSPFTYTD